MMFQFEVPWAESPVDGTSSTNRITLFVVVPPEGTVAVISPVFRTGRVSEPRNELSLARFGVAVPTPESTAGDVEGLRPISPSEPEPSSMGQYACGTEPPVRFW